MSGLSPLQKFMSRLMNSLAGNTFVQLRLGGPPAGGHLPEKIQARLVELKSGPHLSFTLSFADRDETRNFPVKQGWIWVGELLDRPYRNAYLATTQGDWQLSNPTSPAARLVRHRPTTTAPPSHEHDQKRQLILDDSALDWLHGLGVTTQTGQIVSHMADKHRQINRYLEILSHLAKDCGWLEAETKPSSELLFADMGCGKGYLTFGAWQFFCRRQQLPARVIGVERRTELVEANARLAQQIGAGGLEFIRGDIADTQFSRLDALVALHACNTATDDAILKGVRAGAKLIVVAPCCHQALRPQLGHPDPLAPVLRHGLMAERFSEWLTDGLRAMYLEWAGYQTKIIEFVASEHTSKNLMISAVRHREPFTQARVREQILELKSFCGVREHALDPLLDGIPEAP